MRNLIVRASDDEVDRLVDREVLLAICRYLQRGEAFPSHKTLAREVKRGESTGGLVRAREDCRGD